MSFLLTCTLVVHAVTSATTPQPVVTDPQSVEELIESLAQALGDADAALMLELHWAPSWDQLSAEEVAAARWDAAALMDAGQVRAAQEAGDLPLSVQLIEVSPIVEDSVEVRLLFYFSGGGVEEETWRAVWREGGWRLLTDHI
jgi:hypothetical protein